MAFDFGGAAGGGIAGSQLGSAVLPGIGTAIGGIGGGILGGLFGGTKKKTTKLEDLRTPEQKAAAALLQQLATTGAGGGISLGQAYGGSLGDYGITPQEQLAQSQLAGLFGGQDITKARETFTNLADTTFDPEDPRSGYNAFSRALAKEGLAAEDVINREAAISGSRFGTQIQGTKQDLAENLQNQRAMKLAELFQSSRQQQLAGAQGLTGLAGVQANLAVQAAQAAALDRELKNQEAQAKYSEFQRQRGETLSRIDLLNQEASRNPYLGVSYITTNEQSPLSMLANSVLGSYGKTLGENAAGGSNSLASLFSKYFGKTGQGQINPSGWGAATSGLGF